MGGINSALINLVFDYVDPDKRADSLAISQAASGLAGFLITLAISPLVTTIQRGGNTILGVTVYAQQAITVISLIFTVLAIIYIKAVLKRK